ncbi:unnamed protein product [Sympodiomycopsis kandeliae]
MGPPMRFNNVFEQPSSPTMRHDDLPADFDRSFGSSMSISSSCGSSDGAHDPRPSHLTASSSMGTINGRTDSRAGRSSFSPAASCSPTSSSSSPSSLSPYNRGTRKSPTTSRTLGAAMGTELNGKSPGLAAKMSSPLGLPRSSPHYMDISPAPMRPLHQADTTTPAAFRQSESLLSLPPGSAMKEDTPAELFDPRSSYSSSSSSSSSPPSAAPSPRMRNRPLPGSSRSKSSRPPSRGSSRPSSRKPSPELTSIPSGTSTLGSGPLGRLFGTDLPLNAIQPLYDGNTSVMDGEGDISIDKEPPAKRRPASLPLGEGRAFARPSLKTAGIGKRSSGSSFRISKSNADQPQLHALADETTSSNPAGLLPRAQPIRPTNALRKLHRASDPSLSQQHKSSNLPSSSDVAMLFSGGSARSRHASDESTAAQDAFSTSIRERHQDMGLGSLATHPTIIESPSPNTFEKQDLGSYFFDPQSPNVSFNGSNSGSLGRKPSSSGTNRPAQPSALRTSSSRPFHKSHTSAAVPTISSTSVDSRRSSFLGKRPNPYSKRHGLASAATTLNASHQTDSWMHPSQNARDQLTESSFALDASVANQERPTIPAPRRCQSSVDNPSSLGRFGTDSLSSRPTSSSLALASSSLLPDSNSTDSNLSISMLDSDEAGPSPSPSIRHFPQGFDASGSPVAPALKSRLLRPSMMRRPSKDDTSPLPYGNRRHADHPEAGLALDYGSGVGASPLAASKLVTVGESPDSGGSAMQISSPFDAECMPGFGASERAGKVLPCFNVKEDGLMRVTPQTLVELMRGGYNDKLESYQIVDCRFGYEFQGGHIPGAINLSTIEQVKSHFLSNGGPSGCGLPPRSQSGQADSYGNARKPILIFHCEFSAKRAPSMALALRQADRALAHDYPNCHYPEVYVLQGGYCGFFSVFHNLCEPNAYVQMDDPAYQDQRSAELNGFRKQFARHRSFTYGDTQGQGSQNAYGRPPGHGVDRYSYDSKKGTRPVPPVGLNFGGPPQDHLGTMRDPRPSGSRTPAVGAQMDALPPGKSSGGMLMSEEESSFDDSAAADSPSARAALAMRSTLGSKQKQPSKEARGTSNMLHAFPSSGSIGESEDDSLDSSFDCSLNLGSDAKIPTTLTSGPLNTSNKPKGNQRAHAAESPTAVTGSRKAAQFGNHLQFPNNTRRPFQRAGTTGTLFGHGRS